MPNNKLREIIVSLIKFLSAVMIAVKNLNFLINTLTNKHKHFLH